MTRIILRYTFGIFLLFVIPLSIAWLAEDSVRRTLSNLPGNYWKIFAYPILCAVFLAWIPGIVWLHTEKEIHLQYIVLAIITGILGGFLNPYFENMIIPIAFILFVIQPILEIKK